MRNRVSCLTIVALAFATACTSQPDGASDRLAVVDDTGNVTVITDEATTRITNLPSGSVAFQPVWSPDGEYLAYVEQSAITGALVITSATTEEPAARVEEDTGFFYYAWEPEGRRLATLRNAAAGGLVLELAGIEGELIELDTGAPLYISWEPTGGRIAAHIGSDRLDIVEEGAEPEPIVDDPGSFQSPWWTPQGIVAVQRGVNSQRLILVEGDGERVVAEVIGTAQFTVGDGLIAIQSFSSGENAIAASAQSAPLLPAGRLVVVDLETGTVTTISDDNVAAFFWDRAGQQLLVLDVVDAESGAFRWTVWSEDDARSFREFEVESTWLRDFLPFFDQYAQSTQLWSPDGDAFAYPGTVAGEDGVWVQHLDEEAPENIGGGTWVSWAP